MGFEVWGLGFGVWGLGFGVWGLGFGVWGLGFGVWGLGFGVLILVFESSFCCFPLPFQRHTRPTDTAAASSAASPSPHSWACAPRTRMTSDKLIFRWSCSRCVHPECEFEPKHRKLKLKPSTPNPQPQTHHTHHAHAGICEGVEAALHAADVREQGRCQLHCSLSQFVISMQPIAAT